MVLVHKDKTCIYSNNNNNNNNTIFNNSNSNSNHIAMVDWNPYMRVVRMIAVLFPMVIWFLVSDRFLRYLQEVAIILDISLSNLKMVCITICSE